MMSRKITMVGPIIAPDGRQWNQGQHGGSMSDITITLPRHELEALLAAARAVVQDLPAHQPSRALILSAIDSALVQLANATGQEDE